MHENLYFKIPDIKLPDKFFSNTELISDSAPFNIGMKEVTKMYENVTLLR